MEETGAERVCHSPQITEAGSNLLPSLAGELLAPESWLCGLWVPLWPRASSPRAVQPCLPCEIFRSLGVGPPSQQPFGEMGQS